MTCACMHDSVLLQIPKYSLNDISDTCKFCAYCLVMETTVEKVTLKTLKELYALSDTEGRHILDLVEMFVPSVFSRSMR